MVRGTITLACASLILFFPPLSRALSASNEILVAQAQPNGAPKPGPVSPPSSNPQPYSRTPAEPASTGIPQIIVLPQAPPTKPEPSSSTSSLIGLAWPVTVIILALLFAYNPRLGRLLGMAPKYISKIAGPGGISLEINAAAAKEQKVYFTESFGELKSNSKSEYNQMASAYQIRDRIAQVITVGLPAVLQNKATAAGQREALRATVHVPDIVFEGSLYQLTDYYPLPRGGGGSGRRFSQRYGMMGRAWRLKNSVGTGEALPPAPANATPAEREEWERGTVRKLIQEWGMFEEEARPASRGHPSYLCIMLRTQEGTHGLLFIDSTTTNAFGSDVPNPGGLSDAQRTATELENHPTCQVLAQGVADVMKPLRLLGPSLRVDE